MPPEGYFETMNSLSVDTGTGYNDSVMINGTYTGSASDIKIRLVNSNGIVTNTYDGSINEGIIENI